MTLPEGSGRYDALHGDENEKLALDLEAALEEVVYTIMLFGQWPQPKPLGDPQPRVEFSLTEFIANEVEHSELVDVYVDAITGSFDSFYDTQERKRRDIEDRLTNHLRDSKIVHAHAERAAQQKKEDGE